MFLITYLCSQVKVRHYRSLFVTKQIYNKHEKSYNFKVTLMQIIQSLNIRTIQQLTALHSQQGLQKPLHTEFI